MMFLSRLFSGKSGQKKVSAHLFDQLNRQSRQVELYCEGGIADTFEGRFESMALHSAILLHRFKKTGARGARLSHKLFERVFSNFDYAHREAGVGDLIVGKKMRKLAEAFYGRVSAYERAFDGEAELLETLKRNLLVSDDDEVAKSFEAYVVRVNIDLGDQTDDSLLAGELNWSAANQFFS